MNPGMFGLPTQRRHRPPLLYPADCPLLARILPPPPFFPLYFSPTLTPRVTGLKTPVRTDWEGTFKDSEKLGMVVKLESNHSDGDPFDNKVR